MLIKPYLNYKNYSVKNFEYKEKSVIVLCPKKWIILHQQLYAEYKFSDHTHKFRS